MKRGRNGAYDWRMTIRRTTGYVEETKSEWGNWLDGVVATPLGYVRVYSQSDSTTLRAIVNGTEYVLSERKGYTKRRLATMAAKFIERLYEEVA